MNDLKDIPDGVVALADALQRKQLSALDATRYYLDRIAAINPRLNAFITVTSELAMQQAQASDKRRGQGETLGLLDGIPIALKDNIDVAGVVTSAGIAARHQHVAGGDATVTAKLREAGAVILGKTNMHEAALGATTDNAHFGRCHHPHYYDYTPGGSSGGNGVAVAAKLCAAALGTDTLGSVRVPAAYCGCYGFKPGPGLISNYGVVPLSWSLDHVGPLTARVGDLAPLFSVLSGYDALAAESLKQSETASEQPVPALHSVRFAYIEDLAQRVELTAPVQQAYHQVLDTFAKAGLKLTKIDFSEYDFTRMRRVGLLISEAEASVVYAEDIARQPEQYSEQLRQMLDWGSRQSAQKLAQAYQAIRETILLARRIFSEIDILLLPTTPQTAFPFSQAVPVNQADLTSFANLARCPAISLPIKLHDQEPDSLTAGLQLVAAEQADSLLLAISAEINPLIAAIATN